MPGSKRNYSKKSTRKTYYPGRVGRKSYVIRSSDRTKSYQRTAKFAYLPPTLPAKMYCTLKWSGEANVTTGAFTSAQLIFNANSLYDPDGGTNLGNDQASLYDQLQPLYSRSFVSKVSGFFEVINKSTTNGLKVAIFACNNNTGITTGTYWDKIAQLPLCKTKTLSISGGSDKVKIPFSFTTDQVIGIKNSIMVDPSLTAQGAANPSNIWYVYCIVTALDDSANTAFYGRLIAYQHTIWFERNNIMDA